MDEAVKKYAVLSKKRLFLRLHALALPLGRLEDEEARAPRAGEGAKCAWEKDSAQGETGGTDGRRVFWPPSILKSGGDTRPGEAFLLHQVLHCLLGHPFRRPPAGIGRERHDLDCDLAVWAHVKRLAPELFPESLARLPGELLEGRRGPGPEEEPMVCEALRALDDHSRWPIYGPAAARLRPGAGGDGAGGWEQLKKSMEAPGGLLEQKRDEKKKGRRAVLGRPGGGAFRPALTEGRRGNYRALLRELAHWGEDMRLSPAEFDQASYLYGLEHLGLPLLEPLEYEEARRIRELAIVIDTSGSCSGPLVQAFLEETRNLIREEDLFFHPFNLHIIQCDSRVQRDDKLTCLEDLSDYIDTLEVRGMGGTDFTPAFAHIEALKASGEFSRLSGILYFTDGLGLYPSQKPDTETVFIFIDSQYEDMDVPSWARTLVLASERSQT